MIIYTQIDFEQAAGKTIRSVVRSYDHEVLVSFTDGTFSVLSASRLYDSDIELETDGHFNPLYHNFDRVLEPLFGEDARSIFEAATAEQEEKIRKSAEFNREQRRREYEKLRKEFGDSAE
jgi:hypothetical protein